MLLLVLVFPPPGPYPVQIADYYFEVYDDRSQSQQSNMQNPRLYLCFSYLFLALSSNGELRINLAQLKAVATTVN